MKSILISLLVSLAIFSSAADAQPGRFATKKELVGYWEMIPLSNAKEVNKTDPWPMPYQWFGFYEDDTLASMGASEYEAMTALSLEKGFAVLQDSRFEYRFEPSGFVVVTKPDSPGYQEMWGVNLITEEIRIGSTAVKPEDILMSLAGGEDGGPVYFRLLRRIE